MGLFVFVMSAILFLLFASGGYVFFAACLRRKENPWLDETALQKTSAGKRHAHRTMNKTFNFKLLGSFCTECCNIFNLNAYDENENLIKENVKLAMQKMVEAGVKDKVIIHCKQTSFALDVKSGNFTEVHSLKIAPSMIKGSVGAGDSFCAGSLYGIYYGLSDEETLKFSSAAAACNLFEANSIDGMKTKEEINEMAQNWERL